VILVDGSMVGLGDPCYGWQKEMNKKSKLVITTFPVSHRYSGLPIQVPEIARHIENLTVTDG
jgi:hypothetical protein